MKIGTKFYLVLAPLVLAICLAIFLGGPLYYKTEYTNAFREHAESIASMSAYGLAPAIFFDDALMIEEVLRSARQNKKLVYAVVRLADGKVISSWELGAAEKAGISASPWRDISPDGQTMNVRMPVEYRGERLGDLTMGFSFEAMYRGLRLMRRNLFFICLGIFAVTVLGLALLERFVIKPLRRVTKAAGEIAGGDLSRRAVVSSGDELGDLAASFNVMVDHLARTQGELSQAKSSLETRVEARTEELHSLVAQLEQRNRELRLLGELGDASQTCQTDREIFAVAKQYGEQIFDHAAGAVFIFNEARNFLERKLDWGGMPAEPSFFAPADCWALRRSKPYLVHGSGSELICPHLAGPSLQRPYLCLPLVAFGETIGVLNLQCANADDAPPAAAGESGSPCDITLQLAQNFVLRIAMTLSDLRLREELLQQSIRDALTGLFNRRYMEETLAREIFRAERFGSPLAVLMLDVDFFKNFNDAHGHDAGDLMLRELGRLLQAQIRKGDVACRYGGEEFVVILPGASLAIAQERAHQILASARALNVSYLGWPLDGLSLSFGLTLFPDHGRSGAELLKAADEALLKAKRDGRGRCVVFGE